MAHHAAKLPACANCHYSFARHPDQPDDFCPRCGQQNQEVSLHFGHVLEEALEGFSTSTARCGKRCACSCCGPAS